ncbi:MAG: hydrogenase maturation protein [Coleofasciculus sp. G1-WW12-02]|uniref:hydrogenase maturation protein n=1 Tax=Coleofasciculus sp. G1-WW12-02 TaxID=3068483 RepID=UPI0033054E27
MKILLLATAYNSLTQRTQLELAYRGHQVSIELGLNEEVMIEAVELYQPDLIIAPMLKQVIPETIWRRQVCIIIHPGIKGDRGPSALDWAMVNNVESWGVTALQANEEMDAGDIWASVNFPMEPVSKSCLYRSQLTQAAIQAILQTVERFESGTFTPEPLDYNKPDVQGCLRPYMKQRFRAIDWSYDSTSTIVQKIRSADSQPGLLDRIYGKRYYLYGAHPEDTLKGTPGEIIAQRHGAICRATVDGAVWISHLKQKTPNRLSLKLPAALVLANELETVPESDVPLEVSPHRQTYKEIGYEEKNQVGYLHFDFYNGAMSTDQCRRLRDAFIYARSRKTKVIVLMGGQDFWSNGIHLNLIEAAENPADESWRNINAMNDLIHTILTTDTHLVIAALQGNAAAGGVMLALAADQVYARRGIVLNPHYKRMGLYGSEYWTYSLPKRVGSQKAQELTDICLPMGTQVAAEIGLIDQAFADQPTSFRQQIQFVAEEIAHHPDYGKQLAFKHEQRQRDERFKPLDAYRSEELAQMRRNFYEPDQYYHQQRYNFVYKITASETPRHLAIHRQVPHSEITCSLIFCQ